MIEMEWVNRSFVFIFGAIVGSFLNVCIVRMPLEKSVVWPSSHCPNCKKPLQWYDNIPFVSYILLVGHCRNCHKTISFRYFVVEFVTDVRSLGVAFDLLARILVLQNRKLRYPQDG